MRTSKSKFLTGIEFAWSKVKEYWHRFTKWYKGLYKGKPWYKKALVFICTMIVLFFAYLVAVDINLFWLFGKSPSIHSIMHPKTSDASEIYSADGVLIGKYFNENRTPVKYEEINPIFFKALIDTEDERFYSHHGIDYQGLFSAAKDFIFHGKTRGASTITQQLVKNMFRVRTQYSTGLLGYIPGVKILIMKSKEWILATEIEMFYNKKEILTMYANTVDFGSNAYGIKTASKTYFNTTPKNLKTEEAAVLVGLLKATSTYNPRVNPKTSLARRNVVLENLYKHHDMSKGEYGTLKDTPITLNFRVETVYDGQALYFREAVANSLKDWCRENNVDLYADGLKIYTTIDTRMQKYAEDAVRKQMQVVQRNFKNHWGSTNPWQDENHQEIPGFIEGIAVKTDTYKDLRARFPDSPDSITYYMNKPHKVRLFDYNGGEKFETMSSMDSIRYMVRFMHTGFIAIEPNTGYVKAWVGDIDFATWKYDKVTSMRQPGSTFKLFVYSEAMNQGKTPCDRRVDSYISMMVKDKNGKDELWQPHNANGYFTGDSVTLKSAFAQSINSIAVKVGLEDGIENVIKTAKAMGIKSPLDNTPSLSLGSSDVSLEELVSAYCTAVDDGVQRDPVLVTKIVDRDGNTIYTNPAENKQAIPYRTAFLMQQMLMAGMTEPGGTSMSLWGYVSPYARDTDFGGKTGTSSNHSDAWFVGISPNLVAGAWVGGEYRCIHFRTGALGQGSRTALPICGYFFQSVFNDPHFRQYHAKFAKPKEYIDPAAYTCQACYKQRVTNDSTAVSGDSTAVQEGGGDEGLKNNNTDEEKQSEDVNPENELN
jgi:penicillin-binding protein 1A